LDYARVDESDHLRERLRPRERPERSCDRSQLCVVGLLKGPTDQPLHATQSSSTTSKPFQAQTYRDLRGLPVLGGLRLLTLASRSSVRPLPSRETCWSRWFHPRSRRCGTGRSRRSVPDVGGARPPSHMPTRARRTEVHASASPPDDRRRSRCPIPARRARRAEQRRASTLPAHPTYS